jgi:uncharacterized protein YdhG (YjbR/CyaY superfamily)
MSQIYVFQHICSNTFIIFIGLLYIFQLGISGMSSPIDIYLQQFHGVKLKKLQEMRAILQKALPEAEECISYGMPAYRMSTVLVYFAGNKEHVGFYPTSSGISKFEEVLGDWEYSKGAIQFPYESKLPRGLIKRIAIMRKEEVEKSIQQKCKLKANPGVAREYEKVIQKMDTVLRDSGLAKPALRALIDHNIKTMKALKKLDSNTLHTMHGIGPKAVSIIKKLLNEHN